MSIKVRLIIMNFLQFFVWGSWLISLGGYMGRELHFEGGQIGAIFATMGIASLVMPGTLTKVMPETDAPTIPKATIYQGDRRLAR